MRSQEIIASSINGVTQDGFKTESVTGDITRVANGSTTTVATADVLTSFTTPIELVSAPGAGKAIIVHKISCTEDYAGVAYATNTTLEFRYTDGSGTKVTADLANVLAATADVYTTVGGIEAELVLTPNAAIVVSTATGNPATGTSDIKFDVIYSIVTLVTESTR